MTIEVCILAGGLSARMGKDKTRIRLADRTLLAHVRASARATGFPVRIIRHDLVPRCGPLGGIYTALVTTRAEAVVFVPCDMPFISPELIQHCIRRLSRRRRANFVACQGRVGFPSVMRRNALAIVRRHLADQRFSLQELARSLRARVIRLPRRQTHELFNINTPDDLVKARQTLAAR